MCYNEGPGKICSSSYSLVRAWQHLPPPPCCSLTFVFVCCVCVRLAHCAVHDENMDGELSKQELFRFFLASLRVSVNENIEQSTPSLERLARNACAHSRELCRVYPQ